MESTVASEWHALELSIRGRFRTLAGVDHRGFTEKLQYAIFPSFANCERLDILTPTRGGDTIAYRTTWKRNVDLEAFASPIERLKHPKPFQPTIASERLSVASETLDSIVEMLSSVTIRMNADHSAGLDGTSYELQIGEYFGWCRIKWWVSLPKSWRAIAPAVKKLDRVLRSPPADEDVR